MTNKCRVCGSDKNLKRGWTNALYCSYQHELSHVSDVHGSMPGAGPVPRQNWVPYHIGEEISRRWEDVE